LGAVPDDRGRGGFRHPPPEECMRRALTALALALVAAPAAAHEGQPGHDHGLDDTDPTEQPPAGAMDEEVAAVSVESETLPTEEEAVPPPPPEPAMPQPAAEGESY